MGDEFQRVHLFGEVLISEIVPYTTVIGPRNRRAVVLREKGWRFIYSPGVNRSTRDLEGWQYCLDNGAWTAFTSGQPWDEKRFAQLVEELGAEADFVVAPDIVGGGLESLRLSELWLPRLPGLRLIAVQDGIEPMDVEPLLGSEVGLFLGGTTEWKLKTMCAWGELAEKKTCWYHVARVNGAKRLWLAQTAGADSFDGSSPALFDDKLARMNKALSQGMLF